MVWLYRSPIPVEGGNFLFQMISTCLPSRRGMGEGVRIGTLCNYPILNQ